MAVKKAATPTKRSSVRKPPPAKVATKTKAPAKGEKMVCETCGLGVVVDAVSGLAVFEELVCCGVPMKPSKRRVAKKVSKTREGN